MEHSASADTNKNFTVLSDMSGFLFLLASLWGRCAPAYRSGKGKTSWSGRFENASSSKSERKQAAKNWLRAGVKQPGQRRRKQPVVRLILRLFAYFVRLFWCG